jgi:hypothetical protein
MVKSRLLSSMVLGAGLLGMSGVASANLITNGGFESGSFSSWSTAGLTCSGVGANFSSASGGCVGYDGDPGPHSGTSAAYLGTALGGGVISQSFSTVAGQNYLIDFYMAIGSSQGTSSPNAMLVTAAGTTLLSILNAPVQGFAHYSYNLLASATSTTLTFTHGDQPSFFILDDVSATAVPEPGTLLLLGIGSAALAFARRRRA